MPGAGLAVVQHLRVFVVDAANAVAAVFAHHGEAAPPRSCDWIAWPMSPRCAPGRTASMPRNMASRQVSARRCASTGGLPT